MDHSTRADLILILHFLYVLCVIVPVPLIALGGWLGWRFVRNLWLRLAHLFMIGIVAVQAMFGIACPLTVWEAELRWQAGESVDERPFMVRVVYDLLFYEVDPAVMQWVHIGFAALIIGLWIAVPPRWPRSEPGAGDRQDAVTPRDDHAE